MLVEQEVGADNKATNFLMTAEPFNVTTQAGQTVTHAGNVSLVRLAARVDFYNTVEDLSMTQITFKNRVKNSVLVDSKTHNKGLALTSDKTYQAAEGLESTKCIGAIYSYENNEKGSVSFTLDAKYKGAVIQKEITFDNLPLKRNYLYHVIISEATAGGGGGTTPSPTPDPNNLKVNIVVTDWNTAEVLEWKGEKLIGDAPTFTATGSNVTTTPSGRPAQNPTQVVVTSGATDVTITTLGDVTYPVLEAVDVLPSDVKIVKGTETKTAEGKFQRVYTINVGKNARPKPIRTFKFSVVNPLGKDKKQEFTLQQGVKMAIEYVAEYNVNAAGDGFTNSHANDQIGYFNWYKATGTNYSTYNTTGENIFDAAGLQGYHLPTEKEWRGIVPDLSNGNLFFRFDITSSKNNRSEIITVNVITKTYTADYRTKGNDISYALRFKHDTDKSQLSAWRYEYANNSDSPSEKMLKITVRYLGDGFTGTVDEIAKESYWNNNNGDDITRIFPAAGYKSSSGSLVGHGVYGNFLSSAENSISNAWSMFFYTSYAGTLNRYSKTSQFSVRPFSDN